MAGRVIEEKLESLRRCIRRIEEKRPERVEELYDDWDLQDVLSVNLTRAVQICVDLAAHVLSESGNPPPETMAASFDALHQIDVLPKELAQHLKAAVGFRNIAVHAYQTVNWDVVFAISHEHLDDFRAFAGILKDVFGE